VDWLTTSAENGAPDTVRRLIPLDKVLAEYAAGVPLVWLKEIEQSARVEMNDMQIAFIFFPEDSDECSSERSQHNEGKGLDRHSLVTLEKMDDHPNPADCLSHASSFKTIQIVVTAKNPCRTSRGFHF
jgi:hypothetical protein